MLSALPEALAITLFNALRESEGTSKYPGAGQSSRDHPASNSPPTVTTAPLASRTASEPVRTARPTTMGCFWCCREVRVVGDRRERESTVADRPSRDTLKFWPQATVVRAGDSTGYT
jgi:hypothetical protein